MLAAHPSGNTTPAGVGRAEGRASIEKNKDISDTEKENTSEKGGKKRERENILWLLHPHDVQVRRTVGARVDRKLPKCQGASFRTH